MSLYLDTVSVLLSTSVAEEEQEGEELGGSFKSRIYNSSNDKKNKRKKRKTSPTQIYALISETAKWDVFLKEVIDNSGIVEFERKVCLHCCYLGGVASTSCRSSASRTILFHANKIYVYSCRQYHPFSPSFSYTITSSQKPA